MLSKGKNKTLLCILLYFAMMFAVAILVTSCSNRLPASSQESVDLVKLSDDWKAILAIGAKVDFGNGFIYTRINDSMAVRTRATAPPVIRKCKDCFNTTDNSKDKSKSKEKTKSDHSDNSKVKDQSDTNVKNKQDQSQNKKAETDNSIGKTQAPVFSWKDILLVILTLLAVVAFALLRFTGRI